jgi:phosphate transport system substrate-binding protein
MKKISRFMLIALLVTLLASACGSKTPSEGQQGTITISGAFALYPMMTRWGEEYQKLYPKVQFDISAGGAGKGMSDALGGAVDIGMVSRDVTPEEESQGAYWVAVTKDAVFPVINQENPVLKDVMAQGMTQETFTKLYISGEIKTWGELVGKPEITDEVHIYTRSDSCGAADTWAKYLGAKQENLMGIGVFGDPGLLDAIVKDPLGIGYNNLNYAFDMTSSKPITGVAIVPIDVNANGNADPDEILGTKTEALEAISANKYPSPPARLLNLVTKGKPSGIVQTFIEWILNDGQQLLSEAGYIPLTPEQLDASLKKIR